MAASVSFCPIPSATVARKRRYSESRNVTGRFPHLLLMVSSILARRLAQRSGVD